MKCFTHLDESGSARMVNVGAKPIQRRRATAEGWLVCAPATIRALKSNALPKGDVLTVARIAGIQAAKRTSDLIPLCHPLALTKVDVAFELDAAESCVSCVATVETVGRTGVEMEALTAVSIGLLTIYDMCKATDRGMRIESLGLLEKRGGKSGVWLAQSDAADAAPRR